MIRSSLSDLCALRAESLVPALSQVPNHHVYSVRSNSADSCRQVYVNGRPPATLTQRAPRRRGGAAAGAQRARGRGGQTTLLIVDFVCLVLFIFLPAPREPEWVSHAALFIFGLKRKIKGKPSNHNVQPPCTGSHEGWFINEKNVRWR